MHKTSARPLALVYGLLIVYASLYPFSDWRDQGIAPWAYLTAPWPQYWTGFDVVTNVLGYMPLGFLLVLGAMRTGAGRYAMALTVVFCSLLSAILEGTQLYLPQRVASNVDWLLNTAGAAIGAVSAGTLERWGVLQRWSSFRARWFEPEARWAIVLLALWPIALLFPLSLPFGLGQVLERAEPTLLAWLLWLPGQEHLVVRPMVFEPMGTLSEILCISLGALLPCLLGNCVIQAPARRVAWLILAMGLGLAVTTLSSTLSFGPGHALAWMNPGVGTALLLTGVFGLTGSLLGRRTSAAWLLLALVLQLSLLNQAPVGTYFAQTLQTWEQGRFIRFNGLAQWLGWLWPYATLLYVVNRLSRA